ncbi:hypothetical protein Trydic_g2072 [Trypoxylus dichotomus]
MSKVVAEVKLGQSGRGFGYIGEKTATETHRELRKVYGNATLSETTCRDWFGRFKGGDFDADDRPRGGRSKTVEDAELEPLLDENPCQTQQELSSAKPFPGNCVRWE